MRRTRTRTRTICAVLGLLALSMMMAGMTYAAWTDTLSISSNLTSGTMNVRFDAAQPYGAQICTIDGTGISSALSGTDISIDAAGKSASITIDSSLLFSDLAQDGNVLALTYPIVIGEESTAPIKSQPVDFTAAPADTVTIAPAEATLSVFEQTFSDVAYAPSLTFDVYRDIQVLPESEGPTQIRGTLYLRLTDASIEAIRNWGNVTLHYNMFPEGLVAPDEEGGTVCITSGTITAKYTLTLPIYFDQQYNLAEEKYIDNNPSTGAYEAPDQPELTGGGIVDPYHAPQDEQ